MSPSVPLRRAYELFEKKNLDAILITSRENNRYLSRFTGSDSTLLITAKEGGLFLFCDSRYTQQAQKECRGWNVIEYKTVVETVTRRMKDLKLTKVGFESRHVSYNAYHRYLEALDTAVLVPIERLIDMIRVSKTKQEIATIIKAVKIAEKAFLKTLPLMKPGIKEDEWALELEYAIRRGGSGSLPFDIIVASGENAAMPHAKVTSKPIRKGDMVTIDFGASFDGYNCDTTVTVAVGKPSPEMEEVYQVVLDAHDMAIEAAKPGMTMKALDAVARKHIEKKGYGKFFGHGLGHGVGLAVHEEPSVSPMGEDVLEEGAVFTIEPGIYIPKKGGVRIEDMVYLNSKGAQQLTSIPKELKII